MSSATACRAFHSPRAFTDYTCTIVAATTATFIATSNISIIITISDTFV